MKTTRLAAFGFALQVAVSYADNGAHDTLYAGQEDQPIKALPQAEIDNYLTGEGMGLAKAAELNGYPGPSHVLALAGELGLSEAQRRRTEALFQAMKKDAKEIGPRIVDAERKLDHLFASRQISPQSLEQALQHIAALQARLRQVHLEAHLAQQDILTPDQVVTYMTLRGYRDAAQAGPGHPH